LGYGFENGAFGIVEGGLGLLRSAADKAPPAMREMTSGAWQRMPLPSNSIPLQLTLASPPALLLVEHDLSERHPGILPHGH
jgi:hypothetical protein